MTKQNSGRRFVIHEEVLPQIVTLQKFIVIFDFCLSNLQGGPQVLFTFDLMKIKFALACDGLSCYLSHYLVTNETGNDG